MKPEHVTRRTHSVSVVIPVYQGEETLTVLLDELSAYFDASETPAGNTMMIDEVLLVNDCGPDDSAAVIRELDVRFAPVRPVWLSRNFGQHAATIAGISSSSGNWVVTLDEDGQHDPADIPRMLDTAIAKRSQLVYGVAEVPPDHAKWRNLTSRVAHRAARVLTASDLDRFSSFRLVLGGPARSIAAYCGPRTYLDVALSWAVASTGVVPTRPRAERRRTSGYSLPKLASHFWTLVLSSGTRPLRAVAALGAIAATVGFVLAVVVSLRRLFGDIAVPGWASMTVALGLSGGLTLLALGVVAEYIGQLLKIAQGRPLYVIVDDPAEGPLGDG